MQPCERKREDSRLIRSIISTRSTRLTTPHQPEGPRFCKRLAHTLIIASPLAAIQDTAAMIFCRRLSLIGHNAVVCRLNWLWGAAGGASCGTVAWACCLRMLADLSGVIKTGQPSQWPRAAAS